MEATKNIRIKQNWATCCNFLDKNNHFVKKSVEGSTKYCGNSSRFS